MNNFGKRPGQVFGDFLKPPELSESSELMACPPGKIGHSLDVQRRMFALSKAIETAGMHGRDEVLTAAMEFESFLLSKDPYNG